MMLEKSGKASLCGFHALMRISVEIDDTLLGQVMELTGEKNKSPAVAKAVEQFVLRAKAREFGRLIREGAFDYPEPHVAEDPNPVPPLNPPR
jgi:Arc/MetJ family transcription regulator